MCVRDVRGAMVSVPRGGLLTKPVAEPVEAPVSVTGPALAQGPALFPLSSPKLGSAARRLKAYFAGLAP
jgi:hypothetical protein